MKTHDFPEKHMKRYKSPLYAFFARPYMAEVYGCKAEIFNCAAAKCQNSGGNDYVQRFMDKSDCGSTSGLKTHAVHL